VYHGLYNDEYKRQICGTYFDDDVDKLIQIVDDAEFLLRACPGTDLTKVDRRRTFEKQQQRARYYTI